MNHDILKLQIALTLIPGVGPVSARTLISYCGGVEAVFREKEARLVKIPDIGPVTAKAIRNHEVFERAEREIAFIEKNKIQPLFFLDNDFPQRLRNCTDAPLMLYFKGKTNLNTDKVIAIVGTRKATAYGKQVTEEIVADFSKLNVTVVSGLAYGIDIYAHKACVKNDVATVAVLAHGLDRIYPDVHKSTSTKMLENGGLLTEYISETNPDKENFPTRNRIVAGMCDAILVIESAEKGGALITAEIANNYNRDVFALPGNVNSTYSRGCNKIIRENKAALIENANDIARMMNWDINDAAIKTPQQRKLFIELLPEEKTIVDLLNETALLDMDTLSHKSNLPLSKTSAVLLKLELNGLIKALPGKQFQLL